MSTDDLTADERAVLTAYGHGADIPAIMRRLHLSHATVSRIVVGHAGVSRARARSLVQAATTAGEPQTPSRAPAPAPLVMPQVTPRELETLRHVAEGLDTDEIAALMGISRWTVNEHIHRAGHKLRSRGRAETVNTAVRLGLITASVRPPRSGIKALSPRETEILRHAAAGLTVAEIIRQVGGSDPTTRTHLRRINEKLGATNRTHAVAIAVRLGLLDAAPEQHRTKADA